MSLTNVVGGGSQLPVNYQNNDVEAKDKTRSDAIERTPEIARESFISSVVASRQPPRMDLATLLGANQASAQAKLFATDLDALALRDDQAIAEDLASAFLEHADAAMASADPSLSEAFESMGELLRDYEHLRILRTGELG